MANVLLHRDVPSDVEGITSYLEGRNSVAAQRFARSIFPTIDDLAKMPGMGSLKNYRLRKLRDVRTWSMRDFRKILILYYPVEGGIRVVAVAHGARQLRKLLRQRLP
jgi:plasmid stabilization system protein ParE